MWIWLRDFGLNVLANIAASAASPTEIIGYAVALGFGLAWVIKWHRKRIAAGARGMDSWYFIALSSAVAIIGIAATAYGLGLRAKSGAVSVLVQEGETYISLNFGGPSTFPAATRLSNIWRWYALANIVMVTLPDGQKRESKTWSLFLTFDKPVDVRQVLVEGTGLPQYEVKDRDARSVVVAFLGDILNTTLVVKIDSAIGAVADTPKPNTAAEVQLPTLSTQPAPIKPSKNYFPAEKKELGDLYAFLLALLKKDGMDAARQAYSFGSDTPAGNKHQLTSHLERVSAARKLLSDIANYIYNEALPNHPNYNLELTQLFSNSADNVPIGPLRRELEKYHGAISLFLDRYDSLSEEDRTITADLIKQTTPRLTETAQLFQNWIQQCNERIDAQRELLR
jgi:hypothetical protein